MRQIEIVWLWDQQFHKASPSIIWVDGIPRMGLHAITSVGISGSNTWRYVSTICLAIICGDIP